MLSLPFVTFPNKYTKPLEPRFCNLVRIAKIVISLHMPNLMFAGRVISGFFSFRGSHWVPQCVVRYYHYDMIKYVKLF